MRDYLRAWWRARRRSLALAIYPFPNRKALVPGFPPVTHWIKDVTPGGRHERPLTAEEREQWEARGVHVYQESA